MLLVHFVHKPFLFCFPAATRFTLTSEFVVDDSPMLNGAIQEIKEEQKGNEEIQAGKRRSHRTKDQRDRLVG